MFSRATAIYAMTRYFREQFGFGWGEANEIAEDSLRVKVDKQPVEVREKKYSDMTKEAVGRTNNFLIGKKSRL